MFSVCVPPWKRLVPYKTTPEPSTTDDTNMMTVVSTVLIARFLLSLVFILLINGSANRLSSHVCIFFELQSKKSLTSYDHVRLKIKNIFT